MTIFISYSSTDRKFVDKLATKLVARRTRVWVDRWELRVGDSLIERIQEAIQDSDGLVLVLSKASVASEWCKKEFTSGLLRELEERRVIVMPALIEDCDVPLFIRGKLYADFRGDFNRGLRSIVESSARISSDGQGRIEHRKNWHSDWSIDMPLVGNKPSTLLTLVEHGELYPYCVLSQIRVFPESVDAEKRWWNCIEGNISWMLETEIVKDLGEIGEQRSDLRLQLSGPEEKTTHFTVNKGTGRDLLVRIDSRWLGQDTGGDVLVDLGGQLRTIWNSLARAVRRPTTDEIALFERTWK